MRMWWNRLRGRLTGRHALEQDLAEELRAHREIETEDLLSRGVTPQAAAAHFGNTTAIAEKTRDSWGWPGFESLLRDIRQGFRAMRRVQRQSRHALS